MAAAPLKTHTLSVGTKNYAIRLPDVYSGLGAATGITVGSPENSDGMLTLSSAILGGKIGRVRVHYKDGTKNKSAMLAVAIDKMDTALSDLPDKQYRSHAITSASIPRRRVLR